MPWCGVMPVPGSPVCWSDVPVSPHIQPAAPLPDVPRVGPQGTLVVPVAVHGSPSPSPSPVWSQLVQCGPSYHCSLQLTTAAYYSLLPSGPHFPSGGCWWWWGDVGCNNHHLSPPSSPGIDPRIQPSPAQSGDWTGAQRARAGVSHFSLSSDQRAVHTYRVYHKHTPPRAL